VPQDRRVGDPSRSAGEAWAAESVSAGRGHLRRGLAHHDRPHLHPPHYELTWWRRIESRISDELRKRFAWPVVAVDRLEHSLDNLTQLIAEHSTRGGR
jgi:hypothetical protein